MTISAKEIKAYESAKMRKLGKIMTPAKRKAVLRNLKKANAARLRKPSQ